VIINKNKAKQMLGTIGVQPSEVTSIVDLAKTSLSQLPQNVNAQNALLGKEYFTGDAMTPEARVRWMGTPSVADGDTSLGEGGYGADAAMRGVGDAAPYGIHPYGIRPVA